jgi:hypothetical protein
MRQLLQSLAEVVFMNPDSLNSIPGLRLALGRYDPAFLNESIRYSKQCRYLFVLLLFATSNVYVRFMMYKILRL